MDDEHDDDAAHEHAAHHGEQANRNVDIALQDALAECVRWNIPIDLLDMYELCLWLALIFIKETTRIFSAEKVHGLICVNYSTC